MFEDMFDTGPSKAKLAETLYQVNKAHSSQMQGLFRVLIDKGILVKEDFEKLDQYAAEFAKDVDDKRNKHRAEADAKFEKEHPGMLDLAKAFATRVAEPEPKKVCPDCKGRGEINEGRGEMGDGVRTWRKCNTCTK